MRKLLKGCFFLTLLLLLGVVGIYFYAKTSSDEGLLSNLVEFLEDKLERDLTIAGRKERQWTDVQGRTLNGFFIDADSSEALIRVVPSQKVYRIPLSKLSEPDRDWVLSRARESGSFRAEYPPVPQNWPPRVEGRTQPLNLKQTASGNTWTTTHYEFRPDGELEADFARELAVTCEAVDVALSRSPLPLLWGRDLEKKRVIIIYTTDQGFRETGIQENAGAFYSPLTHEVHVPVSQLKARSQSQGSVRFRLRERDNYRILVHELVHQATVSYLVLGIPAWVGEGIAEFYSAVQKNPGEFDFLNHRAQIRRFFSETMIGDQVIQFESLPLPRLESFLNMRVGEFNETTAASQDGGACEYAAALLLVEYFAFEDGNSLRPFLEAVITGTDPDLAMEKHLMRGRSPEDIERLLAARWKRMGLTLLFMKDPALRPTDLRGDVGVDLKFKK